MPTKKQSLNATLDAMHMFLS
uniref:Uncharacterized protein n=1 Tax=Arundo donax TaxID=35708 RepID=A0A0A9TDC9_ARUDO